MSEFTTKIRPNHHNSIIPIGGELGDMFTVKLTRVSIINNYSGGSGGGIYCTLDIKLSLTNVTISNNSADYIGGGIWGGDSTSTTVNTILWNNTPDQVEGFSVNIFYSDVMGGWPGIGNIDADPMFVDTANGDYRLQAGSPCIDAGTAFFEFGSDTLINLNLGQYNGSAPDMGAYEFGPPLGITEVQNKPREFSLNQNYPNPFNPSTTIEFSIPKSEFVTLKIYNLLGQEIATLVSDKLTQGNYKYAWDAADFASGLYYYKIEAGDPSTGSGQRFVQTRKLILMK